MPTNQATIEFIWKRLQLLNQKYRSGDAVVTDQEYDDTLELYIRLSGRDETSVRSSLMDVVPVDKLKVEHKFTCGSLKKTKAEDDSFSKWWVKQNQRDLFISTKIDGMSIVADFENGKLVKAVTRGDGTFGEDQTDKCKIIMQDCNSDFNGTIRGELTLTNESFKTLQTIDTTREHKNIRSSTCGIINQKVLKPELCELVIFVAYEIVNSTSPRCKQIECLKDLGFEIPLVKTQSFPTKEMLIETYRDFSDTSNYMVDGLVIHGTDWIAENDVYYPLNARAFKVNDELQKSNVTSIEWNLGKTGKLTPVVIIEAVELCGTTVCRASGHNAKSIFRNEITVGKEVTIQKSGDIIPYIIEVEGEALKTNDKSENYLDVKHAVVCPECGTPAERDENGTHLMCYNPGCQYQITKKIESFVLKLGIKGVSETSLSNWNIDTFEKLINFKADKNYKAQVKFEKAVHECIFSQPADHLYKCLTWKGAGRKTITKIVSAWGFQTFCDKMNGTLNVDVQMPSSIGETTIENIRQGWKFNSEVVKMITEDTRYSSTKTDEIVSNDPLKTTLVGKSFCFSGSFDNDRKTLQAMVTDNGGEVKSVSSKLNYFVAGQKCGYAKLAKVEKLEIKVITETEFLNMI